MSRFDPFRCRVCGRHADGRTVSERFDWPKPGLCSYCAVRLAPIHLARDVAIGVMIGCLALAVRAFLNA